MAFDDEVNNSPQTDDRRKINKPENSDTGQNRGIGRTLHWFWKLFSSVKLALILILIITGLSLIGVFLVQVPSGMSGDAQAYQSWVENVATQQVGPWAPLLSLLQFFNVFGSFWFLGAGILLMLNILICSLNRWSSIKLTLLGGTVKRQEGFFIGGKSDARAELTTIPVGSNKAAQLSTNILRKRHYRVRTVSDGENVYLSADKNRYFRLATYVSHLSLILFVLAFIFGNLMGWRISNFTVTEGNVPQAIGHETNLSLQLNNFEVEYYDNGSPKDYRSDVTLYENGQEVQQALIRVNHPLTYSGVRFYLGSYGSAVKVQVRSIDTSAPEPAANPAEDQLIYDGDVVMMPMGTSMGNYYIGTFDLPEQGYLVYVISSLNPQDAMIPAGSLGIEIVGPDGTNAGLDLVSKDSPTVINDLQFTYSGNSFYSSFQVSSDPTNALIWIASGLFILGISLVLYFPHRQVWVLSQSRGMRNSRLLVRANSPRGFNNSAEIESLVKDIKRQLPARNMEQE